MFNLIWGYNAIWFDKISHVATGGDGTQNSSTVPTGEVWVLTHNAMSNTTRAGTNYYWALMNAGGLIDRYLVELAVARYIPSRWDGFLALQAGEYASLYYSGSAANDEFYGAFRGYKMKLSQ
jgi:hypothetical protein